MLGEPTPEDYEALTLDEAIALSHQRLDKVIAGLAEEKKDLVATIVLFSGGNDSTVLTHLMRDRVDAAAHINTGIGIEQTREFVRSTCAALKLMLIEEHPPPGSTYEELVLDQGFPGPAHHWKMYQRLKERGLRKVRARYVKNGRSQRVIFLAGRRMFESSRRMRTTVETERQGSVVWVSPIAHWTNRHMQEYRERYDVPRNEVSDLLHMSGECLCGAFAKPGELDEIAMWFPQTAAYIRGLEERVEAAGQKRCRWGENPRGEKPSKSGVMCAACDVRMGEQLTFDDVDEWIAGGGTRVT